MDDSLSKSFVKSIEEESIDMFAGIAEIGLDAVLEDGVLKDIPLVSTMIGIYKIGHSISELHHIKQMMNFIYGINVGLFNDEVRARYISNFLAQSQKQRNKELEYIVLITNRYLDENKPQLLSKLYIAYVDGEIDYKHFVSYSEVLERLLPGDLEELAVGEQNDVNDIDVTDSMLRLQALGLMNAVSKDLDNSIEEGTIYIHKNIIKDYQLTSFGQRLRDCLELNKC